MQRCETKGQLWLSVPEQVRVAEREQRGLDGQGAADFEYDDEQLGFVKFHSMAVAHAVVLLTRDGPPECYSW